MKNLKYFFIFLVMMLFSFSGGFLSRPSEGAESLGRHISTLLERIAKVEAYSENTKENVREIKEILNKNFTWNGIDESRKQ